ncbi:hypothetical protein N7474_006039 [Penicillium riverlandense]|uniref:uncharacterized protein n=1 Tax=Penicillium riverlandense TaxID=1903569 RepID=UPI002546AB85|nr:uncharacterized protein N7474_006039 [Penicillium riverlandense]KAJ5820448.1 hypothetical protein N7474_006039 [Penicillium riverlandense]
MSGRNVSHGRGGAGNISRQQSATTPRDLVTPTIKQEVYTTGRGGSGNMVHNDPGRPEIARESQDVESPPLRAEQIPHHTGRGGAANAYIPSPEEERRHRQEQEAELKRVRTASKDRVKEIEKEQKERNQSPAS